MLRLLELQATTDQPLRPLHPPSTTGSSDDLQAASGGGGPGGTWPRPAKKRSSEDAMNIWELTRSLAREKSDLADQLARLTAHSSRDASYQASSSYLARPLLSWSLVVATRAVPTL